jgi:hypothetical protein
MAHSPMCEIRPHPSNDMWAPLGSKNALSFVMLRALPHSLPSGETLISGGSLVCCQ